MGARVAGRQRRSGEKGGSGVGKTKVGNGSKAMVVVDGIGVPIGLHVDNTQPHELALAEPTLRTIRVPRNRGRPKTRPEELVADKAYDSAESRCTLRRRGITPTMPPIERCNRKKP
ncbi:transposase [Chloroflexus sp.]|uniref:transposase n=1 Tax=Chloroflexus sp. TaxID=1904827 RepID=UPI002ADE0231|nr:transposase [Chloroflexus sp.]